MLAARPELTPDEVKDLLVATALRMPNEPTQAQGAGRVQVADALAATPTAPAQPLPATGLGSLEASRGGMHVTADCDGTPTDIQGEIDVRCQPWDPAAWTGSPWTGDAWTGVSWKGAEWTGVRLSTLIDEAGVDPAARWVIAEGGDSCAMSAAIKYGSSERAVAYL